MATPITVADAAVAVAGDLSKFNKDLDTGLAAAETRSTTAGQRIVAAFSPANIAKGLAAVAGAGALVLGVAAKGALELQNAQADFQSATGASASEAEAAGKTINRVAGEERASLDAVTQAAIRVRRDLGATGPEADKLTQAFVRFARVTKQDAAGAVSAYDDILDSWGLTASDSIVIMDKMLVSQHKFGGEITENQKTLAALAPAMRAANMNIDDGIALLGLFGAKGLDAGQASAAFAKALTKVKSPEELQALITDIANTEDPFQRAAKAADLFGAKAGAKLANALGGVDLKDFRISMDEAAGATDHAADVLDSTFTGRIRKAISVATADLREFGASFGPGLTGAAALASLLATLGGGKVVNAILGPLGGLGKKVVARVVAAILMAVIPSRIAGGIVGEAAGQGMTTGIGKSKVAAAISKLMASSAVTSATDKLGGFMGTRLGKGLSIAFAAAALVEVAKTYSDIRDGLDKQAEAINADVAAQLKSGTAEQLAISKAALEQGIHDLNGVYDLGTFTNRQRENLQTQLDSVNAALKAQGDQAASDFHHSEHQITGSLGDVTTSAKHMTTDVGGSFFSLQTRIDENTRRIKTSVHELTTKLLAEALAIITGYYDPIIAQDELRVEKDQVAADKVALAATKAGTAQRHEAQLTLDQSQQALDTTRANLLASGQLTGKEQKDWLADLRTRYKTATGDAKTYLGQLIAKIIELQGVNQTGININIRMNGSGLGPGSKAAGGIIPPNEWSWVGEKGRELLGPVDAPRLVIPNRPSEAAAAAFAGQRGTGGDTYTYNNEIHLEDRLVVRSVRDIGDGLKMLGEGGYLAPRRKAPAR